MATAYTHRLLLAIRASDHNAVQNWWTTNIDPNDGGTTWTVGLSATGSAPATAYWISTALTPADIVKIIRQLASMAGLTVPTVASLSTKQAVIDWITNNKAALLSTVNIRIIRDDNDGAWASPETLLTAAGLKRIQTGTP